MKIKLYSLVMFLMFITTAAFAVTQPIPDTGISKCYNATAEIPCPKEGEEFYGQDANYSINPMSYTKLDSNGNDLPITATAWAMVKDNVTGLIWENNSHRTTGDKAPEVIAELNSAKFCGYSDWRLPNMTELGSIVDFSISSPGPTININYFKDTVAALYWSDSIYARDGYMNNQWGVLFYYGEDRCYDKFYNHNTYGGIAVRAVRAGQPVIGTFNSLVINGDGTVSDTATGLMWQQNTGKTATGGITMLWRSALSYCENLTLGGYTDWRLPTAKELRSIVDYTVYSPAIDTNVFKDINLSWYWSSSTSATDIQQAWTIHFTGGDNRNNTKSIANYVLAVRSTQSIIGESKPTVQTGDAVAVATNSATLNGTINPNGTSTTYYFQYGTTTSYGKVTPGADAGSGTTVKSVSANITGLTANTLYHFQLVGTNTAGTVHGGDKTFTTLQIDPSTSPTLALSSASGGSGKTVTVNLTLTNVTGTAVAAIATDIAFDSTILETPTAVIGTAGTAAGKSISSNMIGGNVFRVALLSTNNNVIANGICGSVTFKIKSTATNGASTQLTQTATGSNSNGVDITLNGTAGTITVNSCTLLGDCNCDQKVSIGEVQSAINMFLGINTVQSCCDRDGNGSISIGEVQAVINNFLGIVSSASKHTTREKKRAVQIDVIGTGGGYSLNLISNKNSVSGISIDVKYPVELAGKVSFSLGESAESAGKELVQSEIKQGVTRIAIISTFDNQVIGDGEILSVKVDGDSADDYDLSFKVSASDEGGGEILVK